MVRNANTRMTVMKKKLLYPQSPRNRRHKVPHRTTQGSPGLVRRQREQGENMGKSFYCGFHGKEWLRQGKQA